MVRWTLPRGAMTRDRQVRVVGVALYAAIVGAAWWWQPEALPFVVPSAAFGMVMHAGMGRPWLGQAGFWLLLVVVPAVLFPSLLTEAFAGLTEGP